MARNPLLVLGAVVRGAAATVGARRRSVVALLVALLPTPQVGVIRSCSSPLAELDVAGLHSRALVALGMFDTARLIGLLAFRLHLVLLGALLIRSQQSPRLLAVLLVMAGAAYVAGTVAHLLLTSYEQYDSAFLAMVAIPSVIAEGWLALWLLARAGRTTTDGSKDRSGDRCGRPAVVLLGLTHRLGSRSAVRRRFFVLLGRPLR